MSGILCRRGASRRSLVVFRGTTFNHMVTLSNMMRAARHSRFVCRRVVARIPLLTRNRTGRILVVNNNSNTVLHRMAQRGGIRSVAVIRVSTNIMSFYHRCLPGRGTNDCSSPHFGLIVSSNIGFIGRADRAFSIVVSSYASPVNPNRDLFASTFCRNYGHYLGPNNVFITRGNIYFLRRRRTVSDRHGLDRCFDSINFCRTTVPACCNNVVAFT